ncbi:MAG: 16S rRNA (guanine(966)-N(2))-methyltransferase RsmD [Spirochaetes bacterium]|nr:16S rRNA (guanine(966)-N(2))-methyltransferase RsmD [Spirochaetota bacterium]
MRITGGFLKGRKIQCPPGELRPAMDRMRESVFSILQSELGGASFLDLFCGSGIIGIEAYSRGASTVVFVEKDPKKRSTLFQNVSLLEGKGIIHIMPVERYLRFAKEGPFHLVFLDPPYPYRFRHDLLKQLNSSSLINPDSLVLIHHPKEDPLPEEVGRLHLEQQRAYGRSIVSFYRASF